MIKFYSCAKFIYNKPYKVYSFNSKKAFMTTKQY